MQSPSSVSVEYELRCARKFEITGDISVPAAAAEATVLELTTGLRNARIRIPLGPLKPQL